MIDTIERDDRFREKFIAPLFTIVIQEQDEFVVTDIAAFHFGFNVALNINEAINFGYDDWFDYYISGKVDNCDLQHCAIKIEGNFTLKLRDFNLLC